MGRCKHIVALLLSWIKDRPSWVRVLINTRSCLIYQMYMYPVNVPMITHHRETSFSLNIRFRHLVKIPRSPSSPSQQSRNHLFPVPKSLFINICNLKKIKNKVQASVSLQADLRASDIDVCVVSETHLNNKISYSVVGIMTCDLYRRDRD